MDAIVHIIHPYTYKLQMKEDGLVFIVGEIPEFKERDSKISEFLNYALDSNVRVLHHRDKKPGTFDGVMVDVAFKVDTFYEVLFDERIETVVTLPTGCPIVDVRPESIPELLWNNYKDYFTPHSELEKKIGSPDVQLFIGGVFEACLHQCAVYVRQFYSSNAKLCIVDDLSVCFDSVVRKSVESILHERNIDVIDYKIALDLLKK